MTFKAIATTTTAEPSAPISAVVARLALGTLFAWLRFRWRFRGSALIASDGLAGQKDSFVRWFLHWWCFSRDLRLARFFFFLRRRLSGLGSFTSIGFAIPVAIAST